MKEYKPINVLIFPGGMENGIEICKSLRYCKEVILFSASDSSINHANYLYSDNKIVKNINDEGFIKDMNRIIDECQIDLIYPANSLVIDYLNKYRSDINTDILLPKSYILDITRSKRKTINHLKNILNVPFIYDDIKQIESYPIFVKPDQGYGSQGTYTAYSEKDIENVNFETMIVQEYLPGDEYTIDCFSDKDGNLMFSGGRKRSRIRMATSMHAESVNSDLEKIFEDMAKAILGKIKIIGAWFFQVKEDNNKILKLLEIDVRIAGTMCFNRCMGVNFPLLSIFQHFSRDVKIMTNTFKMSLDRCLHNRYLIEYEYDTVYIDLDDTIILRDKINVQMISFLYQCINKNVKIVLISKNLQIDKVKYLKDKKIFQLFDEIIWLEESDFKYRYMKKEKSIYIDDSFSQRLDVGNFIGIPTFDTSMVEALIDDRV